MKVTEINPNIVALEYRQEPGDKDYGTCLYARFYFNLDRFELSIISDCDNYSYKWCETKKKFLELMAGCEGSYILNKIYGSPDVFNYEDTKKSVYEYYGYDDETKKQLDEFFEELEFMGCAPDTAECFAYEFMNSECGDSEVWQCMSYDYPANVLKICQVFDDYIRPKIKKMIEGDLK